MYYSEQRVRLTFSQEICTKGKSYYLKSDKHIQRPDCRINSYEQICGSSVSSLLHQRMAFTISLLIHLIRGQRSPLCFFPLHFWRTVGTTLHCSKSIRRGIDGLYSSFLPNGITISFAYSSQESYLLLCMQLSHDAGSNA